MDEQNVKSTPLDEAERLLGVYKVHSEAHKEAMEKGDEAAARDIERKVAKVYFETQVPLLQLAMANISVFSILRFGLIAAPAPTPEVYRLQREAIKMLLGSMQALLPVGYDVVGMAFGGGERGETIESD